MSYYMDQQMIYGFPLVNATPVHLLRFRYYHLDEEASRLYQRMGLL